MAGYGPNISTKWRLPRFTVATLPATAEEGDMAYATDGRKAAEGAAAGTGTLVFFDGTNWIRPDTGATAVA